MVYRIPFAQIIGDTGNGFYGCAYEVYNIALLLTSYSLPIAVSKLVAARISQGEYRNAQKVLKGALLFAVCVGGGIALIIFFGADFIATYIMTSPLTAYALRVLAPCLFIVAVMGSIRGYFQGIGSMVPTAASQILEQIVNAVVSIAGAYGLMKVGAKLAKEKGNELIQPAFGAAGGTLGTVCGAAAGLLFLLFVLFSYRKVMRKQARKDRTGSEETYASIIKILVMTAIPIVLSSAIYNISGIIDQAIYNKSMYFLGYTQKEYVSLWGIFSGKYNVLVRVPIGVANAFGAAAVPTLTAALAEGNLPMVRKKVNLSIQFTMIIAFPCAVGYFTLASAIMQLIFPGSTSTASNLLMLALFNVTFYCLSTVTNALLQGINLMTAPLRHAVQALVVHIVSIVVLLLVFKLNIYSVVLANIIFAIVMCFLNMRRIKREIDLEIEYTKTFIKPFAAAAIMGVCTWLCYHGLHLFVGNAISTLVSIALAVCVYAVALVGLKTVTEEEIYQMPKGAMIVRILKKVHLLRIK
jgi:stage V sporulation protein B